MLLLLLTLAVDTSRTIKVPVAPGESLRVVTTGVGEPVVLIPGLIGSAFTYRHVIDRLTDTGRRTIVIEPLGMGRSTRPEGADYSLTAQADRIAAVLDTLDLGPALIVAHSVAGSIALRLAYRHPGRVRAIVSLEGGPTEEATSAGFRRFMKFAPVLKVIDGKAIMRGVVERQLRNAAADTSWITEEVEQGYTAPWEADFDGTVNAWIAMARSEEPELLADHLSRITCPVILLLGDVPHGSAPDDAEVTVLRERVRSVEIRQVSDAGHFIQEEQPDAVVAAVSHFLELKAADGTAKQRLDDAAQGTRE